MGKICKVIYFDEESVTDYLQIATGGELTKTSELFANSGQQAEAKIKGSSQISFSKLFKTLLGFGTDLSVEGSANLAFDKGKMVRNIIKNTILTDFLDVIDHSNPNKKADYSNTTIVKFKNYKITAIKDSLSYIIMVSPYLSMIKSENPIASGDISIELEKIDKALRLAKGYYEFVASKKEQHEEKKIVLRFNINAFRNGYTISDLLKMDLSIFAIKVGHTNLENLNFSHEFEINKTENPPYETNISSVPETTALDDLDVYDVLLAGVESYD